MTDISIHHHPISFLLTKYKKTYFLSYQLILQHDIAIDNQDYVVYLSIRSFGSDTGVHRFITVPLSSDNDKIISRTIEDMYKQHLTQCSDIQYVVPPQSWGDRSDTKHSKCLLLGGRRLNQLTLIPKPKGSGGARAATAQVGPANKRNDTKRCLPVEASLRPGEAVPW